MRTQNKPQGRERTDRIRTYLLAHAEDEGLAAAAAERFQITRQAANLHLKQLTSEGKLKALGATRNRSYELAVTFERTLDYKITPTLAEDIVWSKDIRPLLGDLPKNVMDIWEFGFTEIFNNAIDHSEGTVITVEISKTVLNTQILVMDNGVGIFRKIQKEMNLLDERHAIFELSKGKLTTDAKRHAGWGIFFTSRVMDEFQILSGGVYFRHEAKKSHDWISESAGISNGTAVFLEIANNAKRSKKKVFDEYAGKGHWGFNKTVVPVDLVRYGNDQLVSRSQAKRLVARVEQFAQVIFDFEKVDDIGQAFADEIFRVFASAHPKTKLSVLSANKRIRTVIAGIQRQSRKS